MERLQAWKESLAKDLRPPFDQLFPLFAIVANSDCLRKQLVGAHSDQRSYNFERHLVAGLRERVHPGLSVRVVAVYERAVDVEDYAFERQPTSRFSGSIRLCRGGSERSELLFESDS